MVIKPRVRGFMCITSHPTGFAASVREQIAHVRAGGPIEEAVDACPGIHLSQNFVSRDFCSGVSDLKA